MNSREVNAALRGYLEANRRVQAAKATDQQHLPLAIVNTFIGAAIWGAGNEEPGEDQTLEQLAGHLGISPTTLSTHLRYLGDKPRDGQEGLELVEVHTYLPNRRMKTFRLTQKGKALASQLAYILKGAISHANHAEAQ